MERTPSQTNGPAAERVGASIRGEPAIGDEYIDIAQEFCGHILAAYLPCPKYAGAPPHPHRTVTALVNSSNRSG
ncbi:hypothetical protein SVIO_066860 [Streptomyces violaceusniger]|uniref:Uncharacterized protein n=1 Tax=Streptomyces violaceusniger TaxID=68280 RepID=A0A4D4LDA3_STRVO|nr:hypothetical protein SVIO_066860 [Streptomyces violaceusniger]